jgi:hypothetical protein
MPLYGVSRDSFGGVTAAVPSAPILLDNVEAFYRRKFKDIYLELLAALKKAGMHSEISRVVKAKDFLNDIRIKNDDDKLEDIPPGLVKQIQTADDVLWFLLCHSNPCVGYAGEAPVDKGDEKLASDRHKTETAISGLMKKITEQAASPNASSQLKLFLIFYNLRDAFIRADELLKTLKQVKESGSLSTPGADESFKSQKEAVLLSVREHLRNGKSS